MNQQGMEYLNKGDKDRALKFLKLAEKVLGQQPCHEMMHEKDRKQVKALTYNNLGCYYKK